MEMTPVNQIPPRLWMRTWISHESFWREMATRTISWLTVAFVVALIAALTNPVDHPTRMRLLATASIIFGVLAVIGITIIISVIRIRSSHIWVWGDRGHSIDPGKGRLKKRVVVDLRGGSDADSYWEEKSEALKQELADRLEVDIKDLDFIGKRELPFAGFFVWGPGGVPDYWVFPDGDYKGDSCDEDRKQT